jgi:hypothetical protein
MGSSSSKAHARGTATGLGFWGTIFGGLAMLIPGVNVAVGAVIIGTTVAAATVKAVVAETCDYPRGDNSETYAESMNSGAYWEGTWNGAGAAAGIAAGVITGAGLLEAAGVAATGVELTVEVGLSTGCGAAASVGLSGGELFASGEVGNTRVDSRDKPRIEASPAPKKAAVPPAPEKKARSLGRRTKTSPPNTRKQSFAKYARSSEQARPDTPRPKRKRATFMESGRVAARTGLSVYADKRLDHALPKHVPLVTTMIGTGYEAAEQYLATHGGSESAPGAPMSDNEATAVVGGAIVKTAAYAMAGPAGAVAAAADITADVLDGAPRARKVAKAFAHTAKESVRHHPERSHIVIPAPSGAGGMVIPNPSISG